MTWAPTKTQEAFFNALNGDTTLQTLLGGAGKIFDSVPDNTAFPYVVLNIKPWTDRGNHVSEGLTADPIIHVFYQSPNRGDLKVQNIQARIDALIHKIDISITGWTIISLRRTTLDILIDPDNVTLHGIQIYKLLIGEVI